MRAFAMSRNDGGGSFQTNPRRSRCMVRIDHFAGGKAATGNE